MSKDRDLGSENNDPKLIKRTIRYASNLYHGKLTFPENEDGMYAALRCLVVHRRNMLEKIKNGKEVTRFEILSGLEKTRAIFEKKSDDWAGLFDLNNRAYIAISGKHRNNINFIEACSSLHLSTASIIYIRLSKEAKTDANEVFNKMIGGFIKQTKVGHREAIHYARKLMNSVAVNGTLGDKGDEVFPFIDTKYLVPEIWEQEQA